ncbi:MAG: hypothetical protein IT160_02095 [Bryobacterales bacterium]|nr:hypothetical protein [Bryobacterales bacterium]
MDVEYRYDTTGHNNGQIGSMKDRVSGTTNRITSSGFSYNANVTMAAMPNWQGTYHKESRLVDVTQSQNGTESYEYDGAGRRIWTSNETMMFYGVDGKRLAKCQIQEVSYPAYGYTFACTGITYLLGQVVAGEGEASSSRPWGTARDRLGSVRVAPYGYYYHDQGVNASSYFPYGQARTGGSVWATYQPSSVSGTMYAMNREYSAAYGRFLTPDRYMASSGVADPGSWNRYAYVQGDPVNYTDQQGLRLGLVTDLSYEDPAGRSIFEFSWVLWGPLGGGSRTFGPLLGGEGYTTIPGTVDGVPVSLGDGEGGRLLPGIPFNFDRGPSTSSPANNPPCGVSVSSIDRYLDSKGSPLVGQGSNFMATGLKYNLDLRLLVAISGAETTFGIHITAGQVNALNVLYNGKQSPFTDWQLNINAAGNSFTNPANDYDLTDTSTM